METHFRYTLLEHYDSTVPKNVILAREAYWKQALDNYQYAIELNPDSPAVQARKMAIDILNFYHKDMFNQ